MALYLSPIGFPISKRQAVHTNWPPPPPSPLDDVERTRRHVQQHAHFLKLMKEVFPGLPY
jgi:hypothetical protein